MDVWAKIAFIWLIANAIIVAHGGTVRSFPRYDYGMIRHIFVGIFHDQQFLFYRRQRS